MLTTQSQSDQFPPFSPTPEQTSRILRALSDPTRTLLGIAEEHETTLEQLTLFLTRPDIVQRLDAIEHAVARRTRLMATGYLPTVVQSLARMIDAAEEDAQAASTPDLRRRAHDTARRAATLLHRLARFHPTPPRARGSGVPPELSSRQSLLPSNAPAAHTTAPNHDITPIPATHCEPPLSPRLPFRRVAPT